MRGSLALVVILMAGVPRPVAQDRLFVGTREVGAMGHFGADMGPAPVLPWVPRFGGKRYVHDPDRGIIDLRTGGAKQVGDGFPVAYDRARPRISVGRSDGVWAVDVSTSWSFLVLPVSVTGLATCVHTTSADVLFCVFRRPDGQHDIVRSGPVHVTTTPFADAFTGNWVVTPDASRIYFKHCARRRAPRPRTSAWSPTSESWTWRPAPWPRPVVSTRSGRWNWCGTRGTIECLRWGPASTSSPGTSSSSGSAATGGRCWDLAISPHSARLYLNVYDYSYGGSWATLSAYEAEALRSLEPGILRTGAACRIAVVTAPGAPRDLQARVAGQDLALTWPNIGAASNFVLDVGFAPGRTDCRCLSGQSRLRGSAACLRGRTTCG